MSSDYRLSTALAARLLGLGLVVLGLVVFATTALVVLLDLSVLVVLVVAAVGVGDLVAAAVVLRRRAYVVRLGEHGYRVRLVRGAGVTSARWKDVEDVVAASPRGIDCVVLRLRDGRSTTIPVAALAVDRDEFVRDLQAHLQRGHGLRPL